MDAARRELPATEVTKDYAFTGPAGPVSLAGMFGGRRQLITYHFMWRHAESGLALIPPSHEEPEAHTRQATSA